MKQLFSTQTGRLIFAAILVVLAFPILYLGTINNSNGLSTVGVLIIVVGLALSPIYSFLHKETL